MWSQIWTYFQTLCAGGRPRPRGKPAGLPIGDLARQVASAASADPPPLPPAAAAAVVSLQPGQSSTAKSAYETLLQGILQSRLADAAAAEAAPAAQKPSAPHAGAGPASQSNSMPLSAASADQVRPLLIAKAAGLSNDVMQSID